MLLRDDPALLARVLRTLLDAEVGVDEVRRQSRSLLDRYLELTGAQKGQSLS